jgi:hypothetical protein
LAEVAEAERDNSCGLVYATNIDIATSSKHAVDVLRNSLTEHNSVHVDCASSAVSNETVICEHHNVELFSESEGKMVSYLSEGVARISGICIKCQSVLTREDAEHSYSCLTKDVFAKWKRYRDSFAVGLVMPCHILFQVVHKMEKVFRQNFNDKCRRDDVAKSLFEVLNPQCDLSFLFAAHLEHVLHLSEKLLTCIL